MTIVGVLLLSTFIGSAVAAPAVQQILIMNDPLNVRILGGTPSVQITSVDIGIANIIPGLSQGIISPSCCGQSTSGILVLLNAPSGRINYTSAFSFAPARGFIHVNSAVLTITYKMESGNQGDGLSVQLNGNPPTTIELFRDGRPITSTRTLQSQDVRTGSNVINIGLTNDTPGGFTSSYYLYQVQLTVEYTFMA